MQITPFYEPDTGTWTYLLTDPETREAAIIDPVWVFDPVSGRTDPAHIEQALSQVEQQDLNLRWVLETHAHADHLSSAGLIRRRTGAKVAIGRGIRAVQANFSRIFNLEGFPADGSQFDRLLEEGDTIPLGQLEIRVMETPGHTSDSLTYLVGDAAFVGDTLFAPDFGTARCDFPGGSAEMLFDSIARIHALPGDTRLHLCHDYPKDGAEPTSMVTVAESRARNVHVGNGTEREAFIEMRTRRDAGLNLPRLIYASLQVNIRGGRAPSAESNGASYLKLPIQATMEELLAGDG